MCDIEKWVGASQLMVVDMVEAILLTTSQTQLRARANPSIVSYYDMNVNLNERLPAPKMQ